MSRDRSMQSAATDRDQATNDRNQATSDRDQQTTAAGPWSGFYAGLTRVDERSRRWAFPLAVGWLILTASWIVGSVASGEPVQPPALGTLMMATFYLGELSGRPRRIAAARVLAAVMFLGFWPLAYRTWFASA